MIEDIYVLHWYTLTLITQTVCHFYLHNSLHITFINDQKGDAVLKFERLTAHRLLQSSQEKKKKNWVGTKRKCQASLGHPGRSTKQESDGCPGVISVVHQILSSIIKLTLIHNF